MTSVKTKEKMTDLTDRNSYTPNPWLEEEEEEQKQKKNEKKKEKRNALFLKNHSKKNIPNNIVVMDKEIYVSIKQF